MFGHFSLAGMGMGREGTGFAGRKKTVLTTDAQRVSLKAVLTHAPPPTRLTRLTALTGLTAAPHVFTAVLIQ